MLQVAGTTNTKREPEHSRTLTSLADLDGPKCQDVLVIRQELLHLDERFFAFHSQLPPGFGSCQDLADRALREAQHIVAKHALADVMLQQLLLHLEGDLRRVQVVVVSRRRAPAFWLVAGQAGVRADRPHGPLGGWHEGDFGCIEGGGKSHEALLFKVWGEELLVEDVVSRQSVPGARRHGEGTR